MKTINEAVAYFCQLGYAAHMRDWAIGQSVVIPFGQKEIADEIEVHPRAIWLYSQNQEWGVYYPFHSPAESLYSTLDDAATTAIDLIREYETQIDTASITKELTNAPIT